MVKPSILLVLPCVLLLPCGGSLAQQPSDVPSKNPFAQPQILIYKKPPAVNTGKKNSSSKPTPELKLTATLISIAEPMAIVNGTLLNVGDKIEDMTLLQVDEGRAVFQLRGKRHVYTIGDDKQGQSR